MTAYPPAGDPPRAGLGSPAAPDGARGPRRRVRAILRAAAYTGVLVFLGWQLWRIRHGLDDSLRSVGWGSALMATGLGAIGNVPGFFAWRGLLGGLGSRLPARDAVWVFVLSSITRYLPGGVWPTLASAALARPLRESPARLAGASVLSLGLSAVSGLIVGLLALPCLVGTHPLWWLLVPVVAAALAALLAPGLLERMIGVARRVLRRRTGGVPRLPSRQAILTATGQMIVGWSIRGLLVTVLAVALGAEPIAAVTVGIGGFALSVVAGLLSLMPVGIGARELVLGLVFATLLTGSDLVALVGLSRVTMAAGELIPSAVIVGLLGFLRRPVTPVNRTLERSVRP